MCITATACQDATQIRLELSTDASCALVRGTSITVGPHGGTIARAPVSITSSCQDASGEIGSLVLVPSGATNAEIEVSVVTAVGLPLDQCRSGSVTGCIEARRALRFQEHRSLTIPIRLSSACSGVACLNEETCVAGVCVPVSCATESTCSDGTVDPTAPGAQPPTDPGSPSATGAQPTVLAVKRWFWGDTDRNGNVVSDAWKSFGYNLDHLISTPKGINHCRPVNGANPGAVKQDGNNGIDNSWGANIVPVAKELTGNEVSTTVTQAVLDGEGTLIVRLSNLGPEPTQSGVLTGIYFGAHLGGPPKLDGSDLWPVTAESVNGGDLNGPKLFSASYMSDSVWVSGAPTDMTLSFPISGFGIALPLKHAVLTMQITGAGASAQASGGVIAGVVDTEVFIAELKRSFGALDASLCEDSVFQNIAQQYRAASDIMLDGSNGNPNQTCNGISLGLGFEVAPIQLGPVAPPAAPSDPCTSK